MNKRFVIAGVVVAGFLCSGFGTIVGLGQNAEHEKITRLGLKGFNIGPRTLDEIAGKKGTWGAVGSPDNPAAKYKGETMGDIARAHCDGGDFFNVSGYPQSKADARAKLESCKGWMEENLNAAVTDAGSLVRADGTIDLAQTMDPLGTGCIFTGVPGRGKCNALEHFGWSLHAAQDFYSHSNWVDSVNGAAASDNPPGLNQRGRAPWLDPRLSVGFPDGLISGCYEGFPEAIHCRYGFGWTKVRAKHDYINKDKGDIDPATGRIGAGTTDRGKVNDNFKHAVEAAVEETNMRWFVFEDRIRAAYPGARGNRIICVLKSDDSKGC